MANLTVFGECARMAVTSIDIRYSGNGVFSGARADIFR